jgi:hypothetical protein
MSQFDPIQQGNTSFHMRFFLQISQTDLLLIWRKWVNIVGKVTLNHAVNSWVVWLGSASTISLNLIHRYSPV